MRTRKFPCLGNTSPDLTHPTIHIPHAGGALPIQGHLAIIQVDRKPRFRPTEPHQLAASTQQTPSLQYHHSPALPLWEGTHLGSQANVQSQAWCGRAPAGVRASLCY